MKWTWLGMTFCSLFGALAAAQPVAKQLFYEDFSAYETRGERQRVVASEHLDFTHALELSSVLPPEGKVKQGSWHSANFDASAAAMLDIDYWIKFSSASARYALLANDRSHKAITLVQDGGKLQVARSLAWDWVDVASVSLHRWHRIRYRIDQAHGTYDIYVNDLTTPALAALPYRNPETVSLTRLWILGSENSDSLTHLGPVTVTAWVDEGFPPASLVQAPYFVSGVPWVAAVPTKRDFQRLARPVPFSASDATAIRESAQARLLRDADALYVLFEFAAGDMALRSGEVGVRDGRVWTNDCFELFVQPDLSQELYYHLAGNSSGALYDSCHRQGLRDDGWDGEWTAQVERGGEQWSALVTLPFASLGVAAPSADAMWGLNLGRENPHSHEVLSWTGLQNFHDPLRFGKAYFASPVAERPLAERQQSLIDALLNPQAALASLAAKLPKDAADLPATLRQAYASLQDELAAAVAELPELKSFPAARRSLEKTRAMERQLLALERDSARVRAFFAPGSPGSARGYASLLLSSMTKVSDQDTDFYQREVPAQLRLSGNEYGNVQVLLMSMPGKQLAGLELELTPLTDAAGQPLQEARCNSYLVDFVRTAMVKTAPVSYADVLRPGSVYEFPAPRDLVPVWVEVYLPPGAAAGEYQTTLTLRPRGYEPHSVTLQVQATGLTLPKSASLDTAFCFDRSWVKAFYGEEPSSEQMTAFWQFILDHRLEPMNLWGGAHDVGLKHLDYCAEHGKTMLFLNISNIRKKEASVRQLVEEYRGRLRPIFFGHDEVLVANKPGALEAMKRDYQDAKELFPDIPRLNTARVDERLFGYVDIWCPLFQHLDAEAHAARMAAGEKIWWYPTDYPLAPYANFNLDSPGIDPRVIPLMTWKLNLSGLLFWGLNREWPSNCARDFARLNDELIAERQLDWLSPELLTAMRAGEQRWPEIPWLPYFRNIFSGRVSATNGGGNMIYPGPDWQPWASTRLKNLRDGMQDYEYLMMLRDNAAQLQARGGHDELLAAAKAVLAIDDDVVGGETSYGKDPQSYLDYRNRLIDMVLLCVQTLRR
jgi:hypothetical protein